ncbi:hypothetical [Parasynechococcus marenigrum WH 8102]|uniref:Uncharacterized protein n=1 Tax=Parasynechococcus marenigrum (strain WH8102) TaxID=84588 RepID=Q7U5Y8_PARMW|nr:hypothetical [Parasynechococcus marenigrum WH 8102]
MAAQSSAMRQSAFATVTRELQRSARAAHLCDTTQVFVIAWEGEKEARANAVEWVWIIKVVMGGTNKPHIAFQGNREIFIGVRHPVRHVHHRFWPKRWCRQNL